MRWLCPVPRVTSSNNWVLAPGKSSSGYAQLANDPHLDVNRLPNVWYEVVARLQGAPGHYVLAATMPGLPASKMREPLSQIFVFGPKFTSKPDTLMSTVSRDEQPLALVTFTI